MFTFVCSFKNINPEKSLLRMKQLFLSLLNLIIHIIFKHGLLQYFSAYIWSLVVIEEEKNNFFSLAFFSTFSNLKIKSAHTTYLIEGVIKQNFEISSIN